MKSHSIIAKLYIFITLFVCQTVIAQNFERIKTDAEEYYLLHYKDTVDLTINYPDGRWKIFDNNDTSGYLKYIFHLKDNKVHGSFTIVVGNYSKYGTYYNDSLWTFLTNPDDTTFKVGEWTFYDYAWAPLLSHHYDVPFENDSLFKEYIFFSDGKMAKETTHKKGFGVIREVYFYYNGEIAAEVINTESYYKHIDYESLTESVLIKNNSLITTSNLVYRYYKYPKNSRYYLADYTELSILESYKQEYPYDEMFDKNLLRIRIDSKNTVDYIEIFNPDNNYILTSHKNKKGKIKYKLRKSKNH